MVCGDLLVSLSPDTNQLLQQVQSVLSPGSVRVAKQSVFSLRTEEASAKQYFQFYGFLAQQQNMMQVPSIILTAWGITHYMSTAHYITAIAQYIPST